MRLGLRQRVALWCAALVVASGVAVVLLVVVLSGRLLNERARAGDAAAAPSVQVQPDPSGGAGQLPPGEPQPQRARPGPTARDLARRSAAATTLRDVRTIGLVAVLGLTVVAVGASWFVAGRIIEPVRSVTDAALEIASDRKLDRRLAMDGPDDELHELADAFDHMLDRLEGVFDAQRSFVANASHELRTPLAVMQTEVDVALDDPDADVAELRDALGGIRDELGRTNVLVGAMLALSRAETVTERTDLDLAEVSRAVIDALPADLVGGHELTSSLQPGPVNGDRVLLGQLVANLVRNALSHNRPGGSVRVSTSSSSPGATDDRVRLVVENDGPVVDAAEVEGLFDRFVRRGDAGSGGHGLGLAIVRTIAETHGGSVEAHARIAGGLLVEVELPTRRS